ncbi:MAG: UMP kinase [Rickettsiales bacterium]|nr:MAG: UMP kinase [Rickettsiales bacterium]
MSLTEYKRVLFKVSGEALMGARSFGHDQETLKGISEDIKEVCELGVQVCAVVGGGNIYRGADAEILGMERASADYMGMLATVINALALQNALEQSGVYTRIQSAIPMTSICEPFIRRKARRHMQKGRVVIFAAGIGSPFFTTDSAAVLRAVEMECDCLLKGTNVDGVYDDDPKQNPNAKKYDEVTYTDVLRDNLKVMDMAAIAVARENNLPIKVFSIKKRGNFAKVLQDQGIYTLIKGN